VALLFKQPVDLNTTVGIWQIEEDEDFLLAQLNLNADEHARLRQFRNEIKRLQFLASRVLLKSITDQSFHNIGYNEFGKPFIVNSQKKISISHSYDYVAVIVNGQHETGIDIELIKPKIATIAKKFLSDGELKDVELNKEFEKLYIYWGAKEALYKLYGYRKLLFKEHLMVHPFSYQDTGGNIQAMIDAGEFRKTFSLCYRKIDAYMLVYVLND
jgi:4'-phosphopantetheinyl transferase